MKVSRNRHARYISLSPSYEKRWRAVCPLQTSFSRAAINAEWEFFFFTESIMREMPVFFFFFLKIVISKYTWKYILRYNLIRFFF